MSVLTKTDKGQSDNTVHLGTAGPNQQVTGTFKVTNGGSYSVHGNLSNGVTVFTGGEKTINSDTTDEVNIAALNSSLIDPTDTTQIQQSFGQFGENVGFNPVTVQSALASTFGGLIFYVEPSGNNATSAVVVVPANQFTGATDLASFQYPTRHDSKDATISTDASIKAAGSVPMWGKLSGQFLANSVYQMHWSMDQFGNVQKTDTVSYQDKLVQLSQPQKDDICKRLDAPNSRLMYVNQMYVVKSVVLRYKKGNAISAEASVNAASVITVDAAYSFSESQEQESQVGDTAINIAGPTFTKSTLAICAPAPGTENHAEFLAHLPHGFAIVNQLPVTVEGLEPAKVKLTSK